MKVPVPHWGISDPALAEVVPFVKITLSLDVQIPLVTVHLNVALVPTGTPVIVVLALVAVVILAVPLTTVQTPDPETGAVAAIVKLPVQRV